MAERKKPVVRTDADLMQKGLKGNIFVAVRKAFSLGRQNKFAGTVRAGKDYPAQIVYTKGKPDGSFWRLPEDGDAFKKLHSAAKAAVTDINSLSYSTSVKNLIDAWAAVPTVRQEGGGGIAANSLANIKL